MNGLVGVAQAKARMCLAADAKTVHTQEANYRGEGQSPREEACCEPNAPGRPRRAARELRASASVKEQTRVRIF